MSATSRVTIRCRTDQVSEIVDLIRAEGLAVGEITWTFVGSPAVMFQTDQPVAVQALRELDRFKAHITVVD